jgi:hypothetical protein
MTVEVMFEAWLHDDQSGREGSPSADPTSNETFSVSSAASE